MKEMLYISILLLFCKSVTALPDNCNNTNASATTFYYDTVFFEVCENENKYYLKNEQKQIYVWDQMNSASCSVTLNTTPTQLNNPFFENHPLESTVYWVAENTYNYFDQNYNWKGLDGKGSTINLLILNRDDFGYCPEFKRIFIGKHSQATIDIIAHEIFHGISHAALGLNSIGESGALKESFSDIFGEVIECKILSINDWLVRALPNDSTTAFRSFKNPNQFEDAKTYLTDPYWEDGYGGQYTNAGVQNHWFYLLSIGNENVEGIGINEAAKIMFKTLTHYLLPNAAYKDVRDGSIQAAKDIYGPNSVQQEQVALAWDEVGVFDLNSCVDTYVITSADDFNKIPAVCNFISTKGNIVTPQNMEINLTAGNWVGLSYDFEIPKNTSFNIKINKI